MINKLNPCKKQGRKEVKMIIERSTIIMEDEITSIIVYYKDDSTNVYHLLLGNDCFQKIGRFYSWKKWNIAALKFFFDSIEEEEKNSIEEVVISSYDTNKGATKMIAAYFTSEDSFSTCEIEIKKI